MKKQTNLKLNIIQILLITSLLLIILSSINTFAADPVSEIERGTNQAVSWGKRIVALFAGTPLIVWTLVWIIRDVFKLIQKTADATVKKDLIAKVLILLVSGGVITWLLSTSA